MSIRIAVAATLAIATVTAGAADKNRSWKDASVTLGDIKMHYLEAGAGARNLVFVPGWTMPAEVWKEQIPYFAGRGFHVYAIDPRSQGQTTKSEAGNTYHQQAADLFAFLKTLRLEHAALVGWSSGVVVLLDYISSPETLQPDKLVLVDGMPTGQKQDDYPVPFTLDQAREFVLNLQEDRAKFTEKFVRSMFKSRQPEIVYKDLIDSSLKTSTGTAVSLFVDGVLGDRRPALRRIPCPTLVVVSPESRLIGEYLKAKIERSKLEVIADAGHALFLDKPQSFNQVVESFLGEQ